MIALESLRGIEQRDHFAFHRVHTYDRGARTFKCKPRIKKEEMKNRTKPTPPSKRAGPIRGQRCGMVQVALVERARPTLSVCCCNKRPVRPTVERQSRGWQHVQRRGVAWWPFVRLPQHLLLLSTAPTLHVHAMDHGLF